MAAARRDSCRLHGRGDGVGAPRRAADDADHRRSPARPGIARARDRAGRRCRWARWSPASCGSTATSPSRVACWSRGLLWGVFVATAAALLLQGIGGFVGGCHRRHEPRDRGAGHRGGQQGRCSSCCCCGGGAPSSTACSTASCTPAWSASASRSPRTSSTSPRPTTAPTASARAASDALTGTFVAALPGQPVRAPALHGLHRHRGRHRGEHAAAASVRILAPLARVRLRRDGPRHLERRRRSSAPRNFLARLPHADGAGLPAASSGFAVWARRSERPDARRALCRRGAARAPPGHRHRLGRRPRAPAAQPRLRSRSAAGPEAERAMRDYQQAAIELGFLHSRYLRGVAASRLRRARPGLRRPASARSAPTIAFPGQVVPTR